ncbi:MAG: amidohydrolase family protein, partial [Cytophagales bacterium]|nr:amidohydrolase family protein [Cytophagales bacterium]
ISIHTFAQPPAPGTVSGEVFIYGATLHIGNGKSIENGYIKLSKGKIESIGNLPITGKDTVGAKVIKARGMHVYPGFILMNTSLGLLEAGAVRATRDKYETGSENSNSRSIVAYNAESELIYATRINGVLTAQIVPRGGLVMGQSSAVQLDAWNWEDAALNTDEGIHLNWPSKFGSPEEPEQKANFKESQKKQVDELDKLFADAQVYSQVSPKVINLRLAPITGLFGGEKTLYIHVQFAGDIVDAIYWAKRRGVKKMAIVGGHESHLVAGFLRDNHIPVVLNKIHQLPLTEDEEFSMPFLLPKILADSGVAFAMAYEYDEQSARNLSFLAGSAVAYGLTYERAVASITSVPAEILGLGNKMGTLEKGKDATLFISKGDALDMQGNILVYAYIQGREIVLDNKQLQLYRKYAKKYGIVTK